MAAGKGMMAGWSESHDGEACRREQRAWSDIVRRAASRDQRRRDPSTGEVVGDFGADEVAVIGRDVYLYCPGGYGRTKLSNAFLERRLGSVATTRTWGTVNALARLLDE